MRSLGWGEEDDEEDDDFEVGEEEVDEGGPAVEVDGCLFGREMLASAEGDG